MTKDAKEEAVAKDFEELQNITAACLTNAESLIKSAKILLDQDVDHICYHLAALALEEIGKITLLRMKFGSKAAGKSDTFQTPVIDDHTKNCFGPCGVLCLDRQELQKNKWTPLKAWPHTYTVLDCAHSMLTRQLLSRRRRRSHTMRLLL